MKQGIDSLISELMIDVGTIRVLTDNLYRSCRQGDLSAEEVLTRVQAINDLSKEVETLIDGDKQ